MKKLYIKITFLFFIFYLGSCESSLEKFPLDQPSDATFFSNEDELNLAVNGAYTDIWWNEGRASLSVFLDGVTDLGFLRSNYYGGLQTISLGEHTTETGTFYNTWKHMYNGISKCNNLLNNMDKAKDVVPEANYNLIEAQALFLRSYYYSWLISLYGDVPWITTLQTLEESKIPRDPKSVIITNLFSDLDKAAGILPEEWSGSDQGRATKGAAMALKARIAIEHNMWEEAAAAAKAVMDMNTYALFPDYEKLFTYEGQRSQEVIFDMPFLIGFQDARLPRYQSTRNTGAWSTIVPSQVMIDSYECTDGKLISESPLYDPKNPFKNRDPRMFGSIITPQSVWAGFVFETHKDSTETFRVESDGSMTRVANQDATNPFASYTGYCWKKYTSEADLPGNIDHSELNEILIRYAEVLLIYAEAKIELNQIDASVLEAINLVRARGYGVDAGDTGNYPAISTTDQNELRTIIRRERKIELANEGFRLKDIRRWEIAEFVMPGPLFGRPNKPYSYDNLTSAPTFDQFGHPSYGTDADFYRVVHVRTFNPDRDYLWPIPQRDVDINDQLVQNPNY